MTGIRVRRLILAAALVAGPFPVRTGVSAQEPDSLPAPGQLKKMSLEELMDLSVTLVSKRSEKLSDVPSAIQVITQDDIRRYGALTLPEALRLAVNLQVAQIDSRRWAISARGQNGEQSNKLLVMIDGRTVYTPLYSGVFWDVQNIMLDNVDRIEVISGPGGTLWGSNAVNGVINIVTKGAEGSQGGLIAAGVGTAMRGLGAARYGGKVGKDFYYRVWGRGLDHNSTEFEDGTDAMNPWQLGQAGFRTDWLPGGKGREERQDRATVYGSFYFGEFDQELPAITSVNGQSVVARWTRDYSEDMGFQAQVYFDRSHRKTSGVFGEDLNTYDFDFQHRLPLGSRNAAIWGLGYRLLHDEVENSDSIAFLPPEKNLNLYNAFLQDEITLVRDRLRLILGAKIENNAYTGFELMPSGRLAFTPDRRQTLWGAISRAVRTPSRIDVELFIAVPPVTPDTLRLEGGPDFESEQLIAYELGYRVRPMENLSASVSSFYNVYDGLRIIEPTGGPVVHFTNGDEGETWGVELAAGWQAISWWQLRGGYTWLQEDFRLEPGHTEISGLLPQGNDPEYQLLVQSMMDLPADIELNGALRYVSSLPAPSVPAYVTFDLEAVWTYGDFTMTFVGQSLAQKSHAEFGPEAIRNVVPRSYSGRFAWRF